MIPCHSALLPDIPGHCKHRYPRLLMQAAMQFITADDPVPDNLCRGDSTCASWHCKLSSLPEAHGHPLQQAPGGGGLPYGRRGGRSFRRSREGSFHSLVSRLCSLLPASDLGVHCLQAVWDEACGQGLGLSVAVLAYGAGRDASEEGGCFQGLMMTLRLMGMTASTAPCYCSSMQDTCRAASQRNNGR